MIMIQQGCWVMKIQPVIDFHLVILANPDLLWPHSILHYCIREHSTLWSLFKHVSKPNGQILPNLIGLLGHFVSTDLKHEICTSHFNVNAYWNVYKDKRYNIIFCSWHKDFPYTWAVRKVPIYLNWCLIDVPKNVSPSQLLYIQIVSAWHGRDSKQLCLFLPIAGYLYPNIVASNLSFGV